MYIEHVAIWAVNLEEMKVFYEMYFGATTGAKYVNERKQFESYFLTFSSGARIELMRRADMVAASQGPESHSTGFAHLAFSVGSKEAVDMLTARLDQKGCVIGQPRTTGDGYYESSICDPEGNLIEITA